MKQDEKFLSTCDHKTIGKQLGYYYTNDIVGSNIPFISEKGAIVIQVLKRFIEDLEQKRGLILIQSPLISTVDFLAISGHLSHYQDLIFETECNNTKLALRPVTCPFHFCYFKQRKRSYTELPLSYFETTYLFRKCKTGEQDGLYRTKHFTIGDSHIICQKSKVFDEIISSIDYIINISNILGLSKDISFVLASGISKNREHLLGTESDWKKARQLLTEALSAKNISYIENKYSAAFYGPKIDVFYNGYNKNVALFTIQLDFQLAKNFNLTYINKFNEEEYPAIIHRTSMSSYERMLGVLIEKYQGDLPFWLAPLQVKIFVVDNQCVEYGFENKDKLTSHGFRTQIEVIEKSNLSAKIKGEIIKKTHFIVVIGRNEMNNNQISVRFYHEFSSKIITLDEFIKLLYSLTPGFNRI